MAPGIELEALEPTAAAGIARSRHSPPLPSRATPQVNGGHPGSPYPPGAGVPPPTARRTSPPPAPHRKTRLKAWRSY